MTGWIYQVSITACHCCSYGLLISLLLTSLAVSAASDSSLHLHLCTLEHVKTHQIIQGIVVHIQLPTSSVHLAKNNAIQYKNPATNPTFLKVEVFERRLSNFMVMLNCIVFN